MLSLDIWASTITPEEFEAMMRDLIDDDEFYEEYMGMMEESGMWEDYFSEVGE